MTLAIVPAADFPLDAICELARRHPYSEYRNYRFQKVDFAADHAAWTTVQKLERSDALALCARRGGTLAGFLVAAPAEWESEHFGIAMASVGELFLEGSPRERVETAMALLEAAEDGLRGRGAAHVALRVDVEDTAALEAAQRRGFRVVDTLVTHLGRARPPEPAEAKAASDLRCEGVGRDGLLCFRRDEIEHLAEFIRSAYRIDRFHADRRLPAERSHEVYVEWFRKVFAGEWADGAQILRNKDGRVVGFCSFQVLGEIDRRYGVCIIGRGLAAVLPEARGGYAVLTENIQTRCPFKSRFQEFDTQIQNSPVINVWVRAGMPFLRARYTLHRWLDEPAPEPRSS